MHSDMTGVRKQSKEISLNEVKIKDFYEIVINRNYLKALPFIV